MENIEIKKSRLIPLSKWNKYHLWPSVPNLRNMFYQNRENFQIVTRRVGKTILINEDDFFKWVDKCNNKSKNEGDKND